VKNLTSVARASHPFGGGPNRHTEAQANGLRYEKKVMDALAVHFPTVEVGPWLEFHDAHGRRTCQPDAVLLDPLCIVEVKARHDIRAWYQLRKLYGPVVERLFGRPPHVVEITASFDPAVNWPEEPEVMYSFDHFYEWLRRPKGFGVFQWRL
jgi:hypothetical protein